MERITKLKTADGALHDTETDARKHAEARYANALLSLAHRLVRIEKYSAVTEFLDANLDAFADLTALKRDIQIEAPEAD